MGEKKRKPNCNQIRKTPLQIHIERLDQERPHGAGAGALEAPLVARRLSSPPPHHSPCHSLDLSLSLSLKCRLSRSIVEGKLRRHTLRKKRKGLGLRFYNQSESVAGYRVEQGKSADWWLLNSFAPRVRGTVLYWLAIRNKKKTTAKCSIIHPWVVCRNPFWLNAGPLTILRAETQVHFGMSNCISVMNLRDPMGLVASNFRNV